MANVVLFTAYDNFALGLRIMAGCLKRAGHNVKVLFFKLEQQKSLDEPLKQTDTYQFFLNDDLRGIAYDVAPWSEKELTLLSGYLKSLAPDIVGFGLRSFLDDHFSDIKNAVRRGAPTALFICGGYGPTLDPHKYLDRVDLVIVGDGENAIVELANQADSGSYDYRHVKGAVWTENGNIQHTTPEQICDLDELPLPIYHTEELAIIDADILHDPGDMAVWDYSTLLSRGCIGQCSYCSAGQIYSVLREHGAQTKKRRYRSVASIIQELKAHTRNSEIRVNFLDSYFTGDRDYLLEFFERYSKEVKRPFLAQLYPPQIVKNPEILEAAIRAGLYATVIGVQSGNEFVRRHVYRRNITNRQTVIFSEMCHQHNIIKQYHFIAGCPLENDQQLHESVRFAAKLPFRGAKDQVLSFQFYSFPRTPIVKIIKDAGFNSQSSDSQRTIAKNYLFLRASYYYLIACFAGADVVDKVLADDKSEDIQWLKSVANTYTKQISKRG